MNRSAKLLATSEAGLAAQIGLQMVCGLLLALWYRATPEDAHAASQAVRSQAIPHVVVSVHYWGTQLLMLHSLIHLSAMLWTGCYRGAWTARWYLALGVCLCCFALMVTGNLLPFDRHGVQSAVTEVAVAGRAPLFGQVAAEVMLNGRQFGGGTLTAWYVAHSRLLPVALLVLCCIFYACKPYQETVKRSVAWACFPAGLSILLGIVVRAPIGAAAGKEDFSSFGAVVDWYAWPMHAALKAFDALSPGLGWIGAFILPALVVAFLVALPRLCDKVTPIFVQAVFVLVVALFATLGALFGGMPASLIDRDYIGSQTVDAEAPAGAPIDVDSAARGRKAFSATGCESCHGPGGSGGVSGPNLAVEGRKHPDAAWFKRWIMDPKWIKPGSAMPGFPFLDDDRLSALAEYLRSRR